MDITNIKNLFQKTKIIITLVILAIIVTLLMMHNITDGFDCPKNENIFFPYD